MTNSYWDFTIKVKNFSANNVIDNRDLRIYNEVLYRNGIIKTDNLTKNDFKNLMIFNLNYLDIVDDEGQIENMIGWINQFVKSQYAISFIDTSKKIILAKIRLFDLEMAFKFKIQFYNFIEMEKIDA